MTDEPSEVARPEDDARPEPAPPPELDLRVARILEAGAHPNADRLLVLSIDVGEDAPRQLVAGIAGKYDPAELPGKHIVVVANLKPAKLRGEISQGMLLAAEDERALGLLLAPDAEPGTRVAPPGAAEPAAQITIEDFGRHALRADGAGVTVDGARVDSPRLLVDRGVSGRLK